MLASIKLVKEKKVINFIYNSLFQEGRNRLINIIEEMLVAYHKADIYLFRN